MSESPRRVALTTLGCRVNRTDSESLLARLLAAGYEESAPDTADLIVVNSCCVTAEAERKVRKAVRRALRTSSSARVVVTGCLAAVAPESLAALDPRVEVEPDRGRVAGSPLALPASRQSEGFRTRVTVKVQDGCDSGCTYCIVPAARGLPRSESLPDVVARVRSLVEAGTSEVVLTGINLGLFADGPNRLPELVRAVATTGVRRIRLSSIEPEHVDDALLETLAEVPAVCAHLHVPLQSGSDAVLRAMGRAYDSSAYAATVAAASEALPGLAVTTDVIAGFPAETAADHDATMELLESLRGSMSKLHVFRYSRRPGTVAAQMAAQVPPNVAEARAAQLRSLGDDLRRTFLERRIGTRVEVLIEESNPAFCEGTTRDYMRVRIRRGDLPVGSLESVLLDGVEGLRVTAA